jgi:hypothetical protein
MCRSNKLKVKNKAGLSVIVFLILFGASIACASFNQYEDEMNGDSQKSLDCLLDFTTKSCNPIKPNPDCAKILECIRQDDWNELHEQLLRVILIIAAKIKEQFIFPSVVLIILFLFELTSQK